MGALRPRGPSSCPEQRSQHGARLSGPVPPTALRPARRVLLPGPGGPWLFLVPGAGEGWDAAWALLAYSFISTKRSGTPEAENLRSVTVRSEKPSEQKRGF